MISLTRQQCWFSLFLLGIYGAAWVIQGQLFLNWDVSYLLHAAQLLWAGGSYTHDFFMPNPPLILYFYLPPLLLSHAFGLDLVLVIRVYFFMLASLSLALSGFLAQGLFKKEDVFHKDLFLLVLAVVFLILPSYEFGQREQLLLILTFPYIMLAALRLQGLQVESAWRFLAGVMAGFGLAIKPQFYLLPFFIELYLLYAQKNIFSWACCEVWCIVGILGGYLSILFFFYPDYLHVVLPYIFRNYYVSIGQPWRGLLFNNVALFCVLPLVLHGLYYKKNPYKSFSAVLALAWLGFFGSYLAQHTTFYYHLVPLFAVAILWQAILFSLLVAQPCFSWSDYVGMVFISLLSLIFLFYQARWIWLMPILATLPFFCYFGLLFAILLVARRQVFRPFLSMALVLVILGIAALSFYLAEHTSWSSWGIPITLFVLVALFGLLAPREPGGVGGNMLLAILGTLLFAQPAFFSYSLYWKGHAYKEKNLKPLIQFVQQQGGQPSIYFFSSGTYGSPSAIYTDASLAQRFDCMWPVSGFLRRPKIQASYAKDKSFFLNMIAEDFAVHQPDFVFVDQQHIKLMDIHPHFSFIGFFFQNERFRKEWQNYRYLTTLKSNALHQWVVYRRLGWVGIKKEQGRKQEGV